MTHRQGVAALAFVAIVWGIAFSVIKLALVDLSPMMLLAVRFALATLVVLPWVRRVPREQLGPGALLAFFFWSGFVFQTIGLAYTTPARSAFITGLSTPLVPVVAFLAFRTRPGLAVLLANALAFAGIWLLTNPADGSGGLNTGDLLTLGCAVLFACHIVLAGRLATRIPASRLLLLQLAGTAALSALGAPLLEQPRATFTPTAIGALAFLSTSAVVTFWLQLRAQAVVSASQTALLFTLEQVAALGASWVAFGETLAPAQYLGAGLILGAAVLSEVRLGRGTALPDVGPVGTATD